MANQNAPGKTRGGSNTPQGRTSGANRGLPDDNNVRRDQSDEGSSESVGRHEGADARNSRAPGNDGDVERVGEGRRTRDPGATDGAARSDDRNEGRL